MPVNGWRLIYILCANPDPMKKPLFYLITGFVISFTAYSQTTIQGSRMNEIFKESILYGTEIADPQNPPAPLPTNLNNPWEITYGADGFLWITEAKGYKVRRMNPATGAITTVLDLAPSASGYLTAGEHTVYNRENWTNSGSAPWPQGGMMGLALHPDFMNATTPKKYVYIGYVHDQGVINVAPNRDGQFYTNYLVRFTYNTGTGKLESPVTICDTLPGSKDHNSGRIIIAPVGGINYLFYSSGDMGAGQFENRTRPERAQLTGSYEGKILRFNLEPDGDASTPAVNRLNPWIPNNNPFNATTQSAVYTKGVRNDQGFAYDPLNDILYGCEHGPFSDDEVNIIEAGKNYGHPLVMGFNDGNYNNAKAGSSSGSLPFINSEAAEAAAIGAANFREAIFSFYPASNSNILSIYNSTSGDPGGNNLWNSVAPSGMDIYTSSFIPGWKNSLLLASLKKGKLFRLKLSADGTGIDPTPVGSPSTNDTVGVFFSQIRFRDLAFSPDGRTVFTAIDRDGSTSGPSQVNPIVSKCPGCIKKYEFLGYADNAGVSTIPAGIPVAQGLANTCVSGTAVTISSDNDSYWVPITDPDGNIVAEINANNQQLGLITSSFYTNAGAIRSAGSVRYANRSITITPANQPSSPVGIRLYISASDFNTLDADPNSGITTKDDLKILKNNDASCNSSGINTATTLIATTVTAHGSGYVLQGSINSFSTFFFAATNITLPVTLLSFTASLQGNTVTLQWKTGNELNTSHFLIERSTDGKNFEQVSSVQATGKPSAIYTFADNDLVNLSAGMLYYRLKIVDNNDAYAYSDIVSVTMPYITGRVAVYPNPFADEMNVAIAVQKDQYIQWKLVDNNGRIVLQNRETVKKGNNILHVKTQKLAAGIYYLDVSGNGINQRIKLQRL